MALSATDRLDLIDLYARAAHHLDAGEPEQYVALFTPDGVYIRQAGEAEVSRHRGAAQLLAFAREVAAGAGRDGQHWNSNILIESTADGANGTCHMMRVLTDATVRSHRITLAGRYQDRFVRTATGWRFRERRSIEPA